MTTSGDYQVFEAGDVTLQSGVVFPSMRLAYKTYGTLNARQGQRDCLSDVVQRATLRHRMADPARRHPGSRSLLHRHPEPVRQWPVVLAVQFRSHAVSGHQLSRRGRGPAPPAGRAVRHLEIALVYGWSMGGMQAYHWAACHPDMVERAAIVCGSARCSPYNHVFLEGVKAALTTDPAFRDGRFVDKPVRRPARHGARLCRMGDVARLLPG